MGQFINAIGIEVECAIDPALDSDERVVEGFEVTRDGSLSSRAGTCKEYVSDVYAWPDDMSDLESNLGGVYDRIIDINDSMGLHIHVSVNKDYYYYACSSERFVESFLDRVRESSLYDKYDRLQRRVEGENQYCQPLENGGRTVDSMLKRSQGKYAPVNFRKGRYDTMEFRVFCAMDTAEDVMKAIELVTTHINAWLGDKKYKDKAKAKMNKEAPEFEVQEVGRTTKVKDKLGGENAGGSAGLSDKAQELREELLAAMEEQE